MKKYKGYYIDKIIFHNQAEIDDFIKEQAVKKFVMLHKFFAERPDMGISIACGEQAELLHDKFGFSWEELEQMEIEAYKTT